MCVTRGNGSVDTANITLQFTYPKKYSPINFPYV